MANSSLALSHWLKPNSDKKGSAFIEKWIRDGYNINKHVKKIDKDINESGRE